VDGTCHFQVLRGLELFGGSVVAELHNPGSCAICQKQLRKQSCAILVAQSGEVAESNFIPM